MTCPKKVCEGDWSLAERSIFLISINYARVYDASLDSHRKMFSVRQFGFLWKFNSDCQRFMYCDSQD